MLPPIVSICWQMFLSQLYIKKTDPNLAHPLFTALYVNLKCSLIKKNNGLGKNEKCCPCFYEENVNLNKGMKLAKNKLK